MGYVPKKRTTTMELVGSWGPSGHCRSGTNRVGRVHLEAEGPKGPDAADGPETAARFDQQRFPRRFDEVAKRAKDFGAGTGVWLSPWGGYGFTQAWVLRRGLFLLLSQVETSTFQQLCCWKVLGDGFGG